MGMLTTDVGGNCSCSDEDIAQIDNYQAAINLPTNYTFTLPNLKTFTGYCVQAVGNYMSEVTGGNGIVLFSGSEFFLQQL